MCPFGQSGSRDITLSCFQYGVGGHFEKWAIKILSRHFWEVHGGFIFLQIGLSCQISKETKVQKKWSRIVKK